MIPLLMHTVGYKMLQSSNTVMLAQVSSDTVVSAIKSNTNVQNSHLLLPLLDVGKQRD